MRVTIADVHKKLTRLGYEAGADDAHEGPRIGRAFGEWQADNNMIVTGRVTDIRALGDLFGLAITEVHGLYSDIPESYWDTGA